MRTSHMKAKRAVAQERKAALEEKLTVLATKHYYACLLHHYKQGDDKCFMYNLPTPPMDDEEYFRARAIRNAVRAAYYKGIISKRKQVQPAHFI